VRIVTEKCRELNITRSDVLDRKLNDKSFLEKLSKAYAAAHGLELYQEAIFEFVPVAVAMGDKAAIDRARKRSQEEWQDIDRIYKSELMSSLPDTYSEFIELVGESKDGLAQDEYLFYDLAEAFEAYSNCPICGTRVVDEYFLAENIAEHYNMEDKTQEIVNMIWKSGIETGGHQTRQPDKPQQFRQDNQNHGTNNRTPETPGSADDYNGDDKNGFHHSETRRIDKGDVVGVHPSC